VGRAIIISIAACVVIYTLVGFAVASNLSLAEIIKTQDYSLAAAARPALGDYGVWFTVAIAMMATAGGILASIFAVSRMLAMLTEMKLVPHSHFGMPGSIQKHTLVYTVVLGLILTAFFDLSRIAALGIIFYLIMDIAIHWGVLRYLREDVKANVWVPTVAIVLDLLALGGFVWVKLNTDLFVIGVAVVTMIVIAVAEQLFLKKATEAEEAGHKESHAHHH
jgi:amino acid transporter